VDSSLVAHGAINPVEISSMAAAIANVDGAIITGGEQSSESERVNA